MAHRLITLIPKVDRIVKNGLFTVKPRYSELREFLTKPRIYLSHESPIKPKQYFCQKEPNHDSAAKMKGKGIEENKNNEQMTNNASSTSLPKSAPKAPNQGSKLGGNGGGRGDRNRNSRGPVLNETRLEENFARILIIIINTSVISTVMSMWWHMHKQIAREEITLKDFVDNYLGRGRVVQYEFLDKKWLQFQTAPGGLVDGTKTMRVRIDSLDFYGVASLLAKLLVNAEKEMKAEPENDHPVKDQKLCLSLRPSFKFMQIIGRKKYQKLRETGQKVPRIWNSGQLRATYYERFFK